MVNTDELRGLIYKRGLTQSKLAVLIQMTPKTFYDKMKRGVFGSDEIEKMIMILSIRDPVPIFFTDVVTLIDTLDTA